MGPDAAICLRPIQAAPPEQLLSDDHSAVRFPDVPGISGQPVSVWLAPRPSPAVVWPRTFLL